MKKYYIIASMTLLIFSSCKKAENTETEMDDNSMSIQDSTSMQNEAEVAMDSTTIDSSNVELLDKESVKTTTTNVDETKGKYALAETKWKLVELDGKAVSNASGKDYYMNLDSKSGKFEAYAGCNKISGSFVMKAANMLEFSKIASTKMACDNMKFETKFIKNIEKTNNYMIEGTMLHFHKGSKSAVAKFEAIK